VRFFFERSELPVRAASSFSISRRCPNGHRRQNAEEASLDADFLLVLVAAVVAAFAFWRANRRFMAPGVGSRSCMRLDELLVPSWGSTGFP
jgi:hypothetical protein